MRYFLWILFVAVFLMAGRCNTDGCETETTQCNGESVQLCNGDGNWEEIMDCSAVSEDSPNNYVCCFDESDGTYSCLKEDLCGTPPDAGTDGS